MIRIVKHVSRYALKLRHQTLWMPEDAQILHVEVRPGTDDRIDMYALQDPEAVPRQRRFHVYGTGTDHPIGESPILHHLGTVHTYNGAATFHIFERILTAELDATALRRQAELDDYMAD